MPDNVGSSKQPWLHSAWGDFLFILSPPFLCLLAVVLFPGFFQQHVTNIPVPAWVLLVLLIDVGHVYSTLFRTYLAKDTYQQHKQLYLWVPFIAWIVGMLLYAIGGAVFWSLLAYLAVYHFIRQQYGFMKLYSRQEQWTEWEKHFDTFCVYAATILPLLYWHLDGSRNFNWFIPGDFLATSQPKLASTVSYLNVALFLMYLGKEAWICFNTRTFNLPRHLVVTGTFLSWYLGIVFYNGDLIFTTFNVVSHGIPYLALIWIFDKKKKQKTADVQATGQQKTVFSFMGIGFFLGLVVLLAYVEEGLWDAMVWQDHPQVFSVFSFLPKIDDHVVLSILVPLLALPQMTHYILDGFIWKNKHSKKVNA